MCKREWLCKRDLLSKRELLCKREWLCKRDDCVTADYALVVAQLFTCLAINRKVRSPHAMRLSFDRVIFEPTSLLERNIKRTV